MTPEHQRCCHLPAWAVVVVLRVWPSVSVYALGRYVVLWLAGPPGLSLLLGAGTYLASLFWLHAVQMPACPRPCPIHLG